MKLWIPFFALLLLHSCDSVYAGQLEDFLIEVPIETMQHKVILPPPFNTVTASATLDENQTVISLIVEFGATSIDLAKLLDKPLKRIGRPDFFYNKNPDGSSDELGYFTILLEHGIPERIDLDDVGMESETGFSAWMYPTVRFLIDKNGKVKASANPAKRLNQ